MVSENAKHRLFAEKLAGSEAIVTGAEAHHALNVLRLHEGDRVELFDGQGRRSAGTIVLTSRGAATVALDSIEGPLPAALPRIHLAFSPPKGKRLDWLLEKAAELGAARLQPIHCRRSVVTAKAGPVARQRWQAICASAVRQSGQTYLPEILPPAQFGDVLSAGMNGFGLIAHTGPDTCTVSAAMGQCSEENITLLIGPEGGWTDDELREAVTAGYRPVRLGQTTLRVETAAVALTAAVIALYR